MSDPLKPVKQPDDEMREDAGDTQPENPDTDEPADPIQEESASEPVRKGGRGVHSAGGGVH